MKTIKKKRNVHTRQAGRSQSLDARARQLRRALAEAAPFALPDGDLALRRLATPVGEVFITERFVQHLIHHHPNEAREEFAHYIIPTFTRPNEIRRQALTVQGKRALNHIYLATYPDKDVVAVAREVRSKGWVAWTFFPERNIDIRRKGKLLFSGGDDSTD